MFLILMIKCQIKLNKRAVIISTETCCPFSRILTYGHRMTCHYQSISLTTSKDNNVALRLVWLVSKSFSNIKHFYVPAGSRLWNILSFSSSKLSNLKHVLSGNGLIYFFQSFSNLMHVVSSSGKSTLGYLFLFIFFKSKTCFMFQLEVGFGIF